MKVAYFGFPHVGGTYQVFRQLREGLAPLGVDVQWLGVGERAHRCCAEARWEGERANGFVVGGAGETDEAVACQLVAALDAGGFEAVFVNVLADVVQTNTARYLPPHILRVLIVHNITPGTYGAARAVRDHVHATVAISPRVRDDLLRRHGFAPDRVTLIPHAVGLPDERVRRESVAEGPFRVLFLGRIEDSSKGVLSLPDIMRRLPPEVTLTVAGEGPDLAKLVQRCRELGERVCFAGAVPYLETAGLLSRHHVMIMPSRFEGFGLTLLEAMAAGCVPVASRIKGVTDWIIQDGRCGLLFPMGSNATAAAKVELLYRDRTLLRTMSAAGRDRVRRDFGRAAMASAYATLLERLRTEPPPISPAMHLDDWKMPRGLRAGLRTRVPTPLKNLLRRLNERIAA